MKLFLSLSFLGLLAANAAVAETQFGALPSMQQKRSSLSAAAGPDGRIYVIGGDKYASGATMEVYDPAIAQWQVLPAPPAKRFGAGAAFVGGRLYVAGGADGSASSERYAPSILSYDPQSGAWSSAGSVNIARTDVGLAAVGPRLYVTGGSGVIHSNPAPAQTPNPSDAEFIDAYGVRLAESFDTSTGTSLHLPPLLYRRAQHALVAGNDHRVYALGGFFWADFYPGLPGQQTEVGVIYANPLVEAFDPALGRWVSVTRLPTPRYGLAGVTGADGKIYTFGGIYKQVGYQGVTSNVVEVYDPAANRWETRAPMPTPRYGHAAVLGRGGKIYVLGGETTRDGTSAVVEVYDPATDTWASSAGAPSPADAYTFDSLNTAWAAPETAAPSKTEIVGWRAGRCFEKNGGEALGGLLVGYQSLNDVKVVAFETDGLAPDYFDQITDEKRSVVLEAVNTQDDKLQAATSVNAGNYLGSLFSYDSSSGSRYTFEYQVKKYRDLYLMRVVAVTDTGTLSAGATKALCYHHAQPVN